MKLRLAARVILVLSVATAMAQSAPTAATQSAPPAAVVPGGTDTVTRGRMPVGRRMASMGARKSGSLQADNSLRQRVEDLGNTVNQMQTVLKQMQAKAAKSTAKDSMAKTNLAMWELVVGHLNQELQDLRAAVAAREDMEARRAALYKQADQKAEAQAQAARAAQAAKFDTTAQTPAPPAQGSGQSPAGQTAPGQSPTPPASNSPSPN